MDYLEKKIFIDLYESVDGILAFTFHSRYKISPAELTKIILKNREIEYLNYEDGKLSLTEKGRSEALKIYLTSKKTEQTFSEVRVPHMPINSLYLPSIESLPKELLEKILEGGKETSI